MQGEKIAIVSQGDKKIVEIRDDGISETLYICRNGWQYTGVEIDETDADLMIAALKAYKVHKAAQKITLDK